MVTISSTVNGKVTLTCCDSPRNETIADSLNAVMEQNRLVRATLTTRKALLKHAPAHIHQTASGLFESYTERRRTVSDGSLKRHLQVLLDDLGLTMEARKPWLDALAGNSEYKSTWVPREFGALGDDHLRLWGTTTVRRSAARLLTVIHELEHHMSSTPSASAARTRLNQVLIETGDLSQPRSNNLFDGIHIADPTKDVTPVFAQRQLDCVCRGLAQGGRLRSGLVT